MRERDKNEDNGDKDEDGKNSFDETLEKYYYLEIKIEKQKKLLNKRYFIPEIFKQTIKKEKESIFLYREEIDDEILSRQLGTKEEKVMKSVKTVNMMHNGITNMSLVVKLFPNAETLLLRNYYSLLRSQ